MIEYSGSKLLEQLVDDLFELVGLEAEIERNVLVCEFPLLDWQPCLSMADWQEVFDRTLEDLQLKYNVWLDVSIDDEIKINILEA